MKLVMFDDGGGWRPGAVAVSGGRDEAPAVVDLSALSMSLGGSPARTLSELLPRLVDGGDDLRAWATEAVADADAASNRGWLVESPGWRLGPPVGRNGSIICAGANYAAHLAEMSDLATPSSTLWFTKSPMSVIGTGEPIVLPPAVPDMVD
ncbi:MAG TPA: fumarylacetoacetate hydrolase family protein, partial [Acidimicrobiales bacterium]|nr:fumarylacetoacetate hydrolase family protein [Acidimicrobiales bacterium]